ncbi:hypothetical protein [Pseudonocardia sp.]|uniref:hypothetical protein n=1 Tax=Pseudonocardia sp. TaxID=60912 RepID=UPI0039C9E346
MTGNVVFIGFALAGVPGYSLVASLLALVGFLLGAAVRSSDQPMAGGPGRLLGVVTTAELVCGGRGVPIEPEPASVSRDARG